MDFVLAARMGGFFRPAIISQVLSNKQAAKALVVLAVYCFLIHIFQFCAFENIRIKEVIKGDPKTITEQFDSNDARITAAAI